MQFHTPVLCFAGARIVGGNRSGLTIAADDQALAVHAAGFNKAGYRGCAALREGLVVIDTAIGIGMAVYIDEGFVKLPQDNGDRVESAAEIRAKAVVSDIERDVMGHVQDDVVAVAGNAHAGALKLSADGGFLTVHVVSNSTTEAGPESRANEGALPGITVTGVISNDRS